MSKEIKVLVCYNSPASVYEVYSGKPGAGQTSEGEDLSETSLLREMHLIQSSLRKYYSRIELLAIGRDVHENIRAIRKASPDVILNFVESIEGIASFEAYHAGLYPLLGIPYTGNAPQTLGNCLDKSFTKKILSAHNIKTPEFTVIRPGQRVTEKSFTLRFPVITKLLKEDASIGISENSVVHDFTSLRRQLNFLRKTYQQEILIEEYIDGRELNVAILGEKTLPVSEISFKKLPPELPKIVTYEGKWMAESVYYKGTQGVCPAKLSQRALKKVTETAMQSFKALECRDYARIDIRLSKEGTPYVIEVNPNPDISSDSGFFRAARTSGLDYPRMLHTLITLALKRRNIDTYTEAV
ncbi:MAG: hypothetical protein AMXMBFR48_26810 [Ignavibacteriales bacterium]|jgi:D-alanine-D-alanine ligase